MIVSPALALTIPTSANPISTKLSAVLRCIGAKFGATWMRTEEWTAHPARTVNPSRMASAPLIAPVILGQDIPVGQVPLNLFSYRRNLNKALMLNVERQKLLIPEKGCYIEHPGMDA